MADKPTKKFYKNTGPGNGRRGSTAKRRRGARQKAMQALYQWDFDRAGHSAQSIVEQFCEMQNMERVDVEYFETLFLYATENTDDLDREISQHTDRQFDQLDPIEISVLRICCAELKSQLATPYKVAVNEALEISKEFGADKGYRFINGIADKLAASLRQIEYNVDHPDGNPLAGDTAPREKLGADTSKVKISVKEKPPADSKPAPGSGAGFSKARSTEVDAKQSSDTKGTRAEVRTRAKHNNTQSETAGSEPKPELDQAKTPEPQKSPEVAESPEPEKPTEPEKPASPWPTKK